MSTTRSVNKSRYWVFKDSRTGKKEFSIINGKGPHIINSGGEKQYVTRSTMFSRLLPAAATLAIVTADYSHNYNATAVHCSSRGTDFCAIFLTR
jgi:hypothetical protein